MAKRYCPKCKDYMDFGFNKFCTRCGGKIEKINPKNVCPNGHKSIFSQWG
jgi:hypothetical protein